MPMSILTLPARAAASDANDGVMLPGALSHLGQQAQCNLPLFTLSANAIASDAVMVSRCAVLPDSMTMSMLILPASAAASDASDGVMLPGAPSHLGQQAQCNLPLFTLRQALSPAMQ